MKIQNADGNYFLATVHCSETDVTFLISQKGEYMTTSTYLTPEHARLLRDEIDSWLKAIEKQAEKENVIS